MRKFELVKRLKGRKDLKLPERSTTKSAGYDFFAIEDVEVPPYKIGDNPTMIATGIKAKMEDDEYLMLVNRSSNPKKKKLVIPNSLGVIDADYYNNEDNDGEMFFGFYNLSRETILITKGEKLGQGIFQKFLKVEEDNATAKRRGGIGSTDKK